MRNLFNSCIVFNLGILLAACGGGGSSLPPPAPPPPVQDMSAPTVTFSPSSLSVESAMTGNSTLSATDNIAVTEGPNVSCTNGGRFENNVFTAPAVTQETESICTATARDAAGNEGSSTLTVTIFPPRFGELVGQYDPPLKLIYGNGQIGGLADGYGTAVFGSRILPSGKLEIAAIAGDAVHPFDYERDDNVIVDGEFDEITFLQVPSLATNGLGSFGMSILDAVAGKLHWLYGDFTLIPEQFSQREEIDVENPCFVMQSNTFFNNDMVIGQISRGLSMYNVDTGTDFTNSLNFDHTFLYNVGDGRSLCHILRGVIPANFISDFPNIQLANTFAQPLSAIDYDSKEIVFYGDQNGDNKLDELGSVDLMVDTDKDLKIVDVISRGSPSLVPQYMLILLTDGNHNGVHRLVMASYENSSGLLKQTVYGWSEGVPVGMLQGQFGGSSDKGLFRLDLAVVLGTSEQSLFFDNLLSPTAQLSEPPLYGEPKLFDVGIGAGSAVAARKPDVPVTGIPNNGILVSFPSNGQIRYISLEFD